MGLHSFLFFRFARGRLRFSSRFCCSVCTVLPADLSALRVFNHNLIRNDACIALPVIRDPYANPGIVLSAVNESLLVFLCLLRHLYGNDRGFLVRNRRIFLGPGFFFRRLFHRFICSCRPRLLHELRRFGTRGCICAIVCNRYFCSRRFCCRHALSDHQNPYSCGGKQQNSFSPSRIRFQRAPKPAAQFLAKHKNSRRHDGRPRRDQAQNRHDFADFFPITPNIHSYSSFSPLRFAFITVSVSCPTRNLSPSAVPPGSAPGPAPGPFPIHP